MTLSQLCDYLKEATFCIIFITGIIVFFTSLFIAIFKFYKYLGWL